MTIEMKNCTFTTKPPLYNGIFDLGKALEITVRVSGSFAYIKLPGIAKEVLATEGFPLKFEIIPMKLDAGPIRLIVTQDALKSRE